MYDRAKVEAMLERLTKPGADQYLQIMAKEDPEAVKQLIELLEESAKPHYLSDTEYEILESWVLEESEEDRPHISHNEPLIDEFFRDFGDEYPETTLYKCGNTQYICMDNATRMTLWEMIKKGKAELDAEPEEVERLLTKLTADIKTNIPA